MVNLTFRYGYTLIRMFSSQAYVIPTSVYYDV